MTQKEMMSTEEFEKMLQDSYTYKLNVADVVLTLVLIIMLIRRWK